MSLKILSKKELQDKVAVIMGTRPGIIKMAPIIRALNQTGIEHFIIHTGQHYSYNMDKKFFADLEIKYPKHKITIPAESRMHGAQTSCMISGVEKILIEEKPKIILVCGDANTNLAAGLAARKLRIIVGHVEAGLRSHDWSMPEEHNRIILDHICELLFAPTRASCQNLVDDNVRGLIYLTGNTIVDSTFQNLEIAQRYFTKTIDKLGIKKDRYILTTCHREENVDVEYRLKNIILGIKEVSDRTALPVIFPVHPRTRNRIEEFGISRDLKLWDHIKMIEPMGYLEFLVIIKESNLVLTDSGGIQEEACILKTPCVTLRDNTERPETVEVGSNVIAGIKPERIYESSIKMLSSKRNWEIPFGDGFASKRIVDVVKDAIENDVELTDIRNEPRFKLEETFMMEEKNYFNK